MGAQSIKYKTLCNLREEYDKKISVQGNDYFLKKRFEVGKGTCMDEVKHSLRILDILYSEECHNLNNIQKYYIEEDMYDSYLPAQKICVPPIEYIGVMEFSSEFSSEFT